jgi:hypothetical protein
MAASVAVGVGMLLGMLPWLVHVAVTTTAIEDLLDMLEVE